MSIASRIENMTSNISEAYDSVEGLGVDLTNVDKNLENLSSKINEVYDSLPKVTSEETDEDITLNDTKKGKITFDLNPNTSQDTTTGKNKFDKNTMITRIYGYIMENLTTWAYASGGYSIRIPCKTNTQYTISANNSSETIFRAGVTDSDNIPVSGTTIQVYSATRYSNTNTPIYVTTGANAKYIVIQVGVDTASTTFNTLQVEEGNEATSFEEYTGGIPAPNPDFPMDIHIIGGDNEIKVQNKNRLDNSNFEIMYNGGANLGTINNGIKATSSSNGNYKNSTIKIGLASELVGKTIRVKTNFVPSGSNDGRYYLGYCDVSGGSRVNKTETTTSGTTLTMVVEEGIQDYVILGLFSTNTVAGQSENYIDYTNLIMTIDNEDMTYEAYQEQTQLISLGDIEYCEIGDNKDKIDKSTGEQLLDKSNVNILNGYIDVTNKRIYSNATARTLYIPCEKNTSYTISKISGAIFRVATTNDTPILNNRVLNVALANNTGTEITITSGLNDIYLCITFWSSNDTLTEQQMLDSIMINEGQEALPYEPFGKVWYIAKKTVKLIFDGTENWTTRTTSGGLTLYELNVSGNNLYSTTTENIGYSNQYIAKQNLTDENTFRIQNSNLLSIHNEISGSLTNFKNDLSNNNLIIYFPLANPTYTILSNTLQTQLNNLQKLLSYDEQTNISQENNDLPFKMIASALKEINELSANSNSQTLSSNFLSLGNLQDQNLNEEVETLQNEENNI